MAAYSDLTAGGPIAFALTVEACPYVFTSGSVASFTFTSGRDADWPDSALDPTVATGMLDDSDGFEWSESVDLIKATIDVSAMTFRLHDAPDTFGGPAGTSKNVLSWLTNRVPTSTPLSASLLRTVVGGGTFTVFDGSALGAAPFTVWIGREAIRCSARASNTVTVGTRGVYGSIARTHRVLADASMYPEVWTAFPWAVRRRVILWAGTVSGTVMTDPVPLWRGECQRAPRLASDGVRFELAADHITQKLWDVRLGLPSEACRLQGFRSNDYVGSPLQWAFQAVVSGTERVSIYAYATPGTNFGTLNELLDHIQQRMITAAAAASGGAITVDPGLDASSSEGSVNARLKITNGTRASMTLRSPLGTVGATNATAAPVTVSATVPMPAAAQAFNARHRALNTFHMDNVANLPTSWSVAILPAQGWRYGDAIAILKSPGERQAAIIDPGSVLAEGGSLAVVDATNRTVSGRVYMLRNGQATEERRSSDSIFREATNDWWWLIGAIPFHLVLKIKCSDWVRGFERGIINDSILLGTAQEIDVDARDWDFDHGGLALALRSPPLLQGREWVLTGEQTVGTLLLDNLRISGGILAMRRSRIAVEPLDPPLRSDVSDSAHTVTTNTMPGMPGWEQVPDGIANVVDVTLADEPEGMRYVLPDDRSVQKYGQQEKIEIKPRGITADTLRHVRARGARYLGDLMFRRTLALHADRVEERDIPIDGRLLDSVYIGEVVTLTEWLTPNSTGTRGVTTQRGVVRGRSIRIGRDALEMKVKLRNWPALANISGWSPCVRVASVSGSDATCAGATYINAMDDTSTDYAGSDQTGYASTTRGTVANDGGTGYYVAGDRLRFFERDVAAPQTADLIVSTVNTATRVITFTAAIPAWVATAIAAGGTVDIMYSPYDTAGLQTAQKDWPFVCDRATQKILATDDGFRWVP